MRFLGDSILLLGLAASACGAGESPRIALADSAGVAVITSAAAAWAEGGGWRLAEQPTLVIPPEAEAYQLSGVHSALRLDDGRIVVANGVENRLLFFAADGRLVASAGREGQGPGEFRDLARAWRLRGDSILAHDWLGARISAWSDQELGRTTPLRSPDGRQTIAVGVFGDGTLLMARPWPWRPDRPAGLYADSAVFLRYAADGEPAGSLGVFPWREAFHFERDGRMTRTDPPFSRYAVHVPRGQGFLVGPARTTELEVYDEDGHLRRIIRWPGGARPVEAADIAVYRRERIRRGKGYGATEQEMERLLANLEYPGEMPAYSAIVMDAEGHLWVDRYEPDPHAPKRWAVLTGEGEYLGDVAVPGGFEILDVGADYVLGRTRDALDREGLALYPLIREWRAPGSASSPPP